MSGHKKTTVGGLRCICSSGYNLWDTSRVDKEADLIDLLKSRKLLKIPMTERNYSLDGLRGFAALAVIFSHAAMAFYPWLEYGTNAQSPFWMRLVYNSPLAIVYNGNLSVSIFFVLSGYVLSVKFFRSGDSDHIRGMFVKRYFRLAPPVLFVCLLNYAVMKSGLMFNQLSTVSAWAREQFHANPNLYDAIVEGVWRDYLVWFPVYNPPAWTMRIEFLGSMMVFAVCLLAKRIPNRWILYIVITLALCLTEDYFGTLFASFFIGVWAAESPRKKLSNARSVVLLVVALYLGSYHATSSFHAPLAWAVESLNLWHPDYLITAAASTCIFYVVLTNAAAKKVFELGRELGRRSYCFYLVHMGIFMSVGMYVFDHLQRMTGVSKDAAIGLSVLSTILVTYFASGLMTTWIDEPAIKWSGKILRRVSGSSTSRSQDQEVDRISAP
jgi:peptidoglycan/LPS O-acetylase OafA/YrhL